MLALVSNTPSKERRRQYAGAFWIASFKNIAQFELRPLGHQRSSEYGSLIRSIVVVFTESSADHFLDVLAWIDRLVSRHVLNNLSSGADAFRGVAGADGLLLRVVDNGRRPEH
jgi:hypothetical protein